MLKTDKKSRLSGVKEDYMDKWKRLKDEKPKYASEVIACTNNGVKHLLIVGEQKWRDLTEYDSSVFGASFITHWMESPELPDEYNRK